MLDVLAPLGCISSSTTAAAVILATTLAAMLLAAATLYPTALLQWLRRKRYQYEVTFSLYMLTPTEKFIFNSFLFLFLSMILIATSLYLPDHFSNVARRAAYYWQGTSSVNGDDVGGSLGVRDVVRSLLAAASSSPSSAASAPSSTLAAVKDAVISSVVGAGAAVDGPQTIVSL